MDPCAAAASATQVAEEEAATTIGLVPMTVLATLAGARMALAAGLRLADGRVVAGAGAMELAVARLWVLVRRFKDARSRATRTWTRSVGVVEAS